MRASRSVRSASIAAALAAVVPDPAQAREPYATRSYYWGGAAGTWFWIDPLTDLTFVGMIQHLGPAVRELQALSRRRAYQAVVN